jgi:signal transduction histidine kinase
VSASWTDLETSTGIERRELILAGMRDQVYRRMDRLFGMLLIAQWLFAIGLALAVSPWSYDGAERSLHFHVRAAICLGAVINSLPLALIYLRPGWWGTRHAIAAVQLLWSAMLIMITGGRIETHFHIFGSLVCLAAYRDWKILTTGTVVICIDHLARGLWWPDSVYGVANPEWWRFFEHAAWVTFENVVLIYICCVRATREMGEAAAREARLERMKSAVERQVVSRTRQLQDSVQRYRSLVEDTAAVPFELCAATMRLVYIAPQAAKLFDCEVADLEDQRLLESLVHPDDLLRLLSSVEAYGQGHGASDPIDFRIVSRKGRELHLRTMLSSRANGRVRGLTFDITKERRLELELQQAQKLESVGRLAAGVAHEINTPVQFVSDSVQFVRASAGELIELVRKQQTAIEILASRPDPALVRACEEEAAAIDLPYVELEVPKALDRAIEGLDRVATIVRGLKVFAHPGGGLSSIDLNRAVESTLVIARNEYRYVADLVTELEDLPKVMCHAGEINQAVLNIVLNASHAITDLSSRTHERGTLTVRTQRDGDDVVISVSDTGPGIPERVERKMFDPFFTTKAIGRGTGQGLAIARAILDKHQGSLTFKTKIGVGTTFFLRLPISGPSATTQVAA